MRIKSKTKSRDYANEKSDMLYKFIKIRLWWLADWADWADLRKDRWDCT
jgi:hypothetical protein